MRDSCGATFEASPCHFDWKISVIQFALSTLVEHNFGPIIRDGTQIFKCL